MCLYNKNRLPSISSEDIVVYKLVSLMTNGKEESYSSPYMGTPIKLNEVIVPERINDVNDLISSIINPLIDRRVHEGFIHVARSYDSALVLKREYIDANNDYDVVILKGYIPKWTWYYHNGIGEDYYDLIAAKKVVLNKVVG